MLKFLSHKSRWAAALAVLATAGLAYLSGDAWGQEDADSDDSLTKPAWEVGDSWMIETVSERIQGRLPLDATVRAPKPIRWQFEVKDTEQLAGRQCYRIEIQCLAKGRIRPKSTIWCDKDTMFLRQFETQLAVNGEMRTIQESYDHQQGAQAPVVTPINALPLVMPAFLPKGSKAIEFTYVSAPTSAGAKTKDLGLITFAHKMSQTSGKPSPKAIEAINARGATKGLEAAPMTQVNIKSHGEDVTQVWQKGKPWPVFVDNGRTKAYLVTGGEGE